MSQLGKSDIFQEIQSRITEIRELVVKLNSTLTEQAATANNLSDRIQELDTRSKSLEDERKSLSSDKGELEVELRQKAEDYDALMEQFERVSAEFTSISATGKGTLDIRQLLPLYIALVEDIYAARPHIRILYLLHGDKGLAAAGMTRQEITKASGFMPAAVLSAIHDLANAGFIGFNMETQLITLERRIFE